MNYRCEQNGPFFHDFPSVSQTQKQQLNSKLQNHPFFVLFANIKENHIIMLKEQSSSQQQLSDPFSNIFQEGVEEFITYQRQQSEEYRSRNQKNKDKIAKLERDMNDAQLKKKRNVQRRQAEKAKMNQIIAQMSEQQLRDFIEGRKKKKKQEKEKVRNAMATGQVIMVDLAYQEMMNGKQNKSLAKQIELIMKGIKHVDEPPSIHLCSFQGVIVPQLEKMGYNFWPLTTNIENIAQTGKILNKKLVYLSPDAELPLEKIEPDTAYILGGLIDRTIKKYASIKRAKTFEIQTRRLPIRQFMRSRTVLNLDHVVLMLCKFRECNDWKTAFDYGAPKRYKRDAYEIGDKKEWKGEQGDSGNESVQQCEQKSEDLMTKQQKQRQNYQN